MVPPLPLKPAPRRRNARPSLEEGRLGSLLTGLGLFVLAISAGLYVIAHAVH